MWWERPCKLIKLRYSRRGPEGCGFMEVRPRQSRGGSQRSTASCFRTSGLLAARPCKRSGVKEPSECKQRPSDQSTSYQVGWSRASATVLRKPASLFLCSAKGSVLSQNGYVLVTPTQSGAAQCLAMHASKDMALYKQRAGKPTTLRTSGFAPTL